MDPSNSDGEQPETEPGERRIDIVSVERTLEKRRADCDPEERPDDVQIDLEKRENGGDTDGRDDIGEPDLVVNSGGEFGGHLLGIKQDRY